MWFERRILIKILLLNKWQKPYRQLEASGQSQLLLKRSGQVWRCRDCAFMPIRTHTCCLEPLPYLRTFLVKLGKTELNVSQCLSIRLWISHVSEYWALNSESVLLVGALALVFSGKGLGFGQLTRAYEGRSLMLTSFLWTPSSEGASPGLWMTVGLRGASPRPVTTMRHLWINFVSTLPLRVAHAFIHA